MQCASTLFPNGAFLIRCGDEPWNCIRQNTISLVDVKVGLSAFVSLVEFELSTFFLAISWILLHLEHGRCRYKFYDTIRRP